jgi:hypothetical protein
LARDQAVAELVHRYFRSHGPATVRDFVAWSGLTVADTRAGIDAVGDRLECADKDGTTWYAAPWGGAQADTAAALLVPMYDETIMGYQDLKVVLAHEPPAPGLLERAVVVDGRTSEAGAGRRLVGR